MGLGFLLIPALAGYWVQVRLHSYRYETLRESGHHVVFRSALTGICLAFFSYIIVLLLSKYCYEVILLWQKTFPFEYSDTAAISFLIGFLYWKVGNKIIDRHKAVMKISEETGEFVGAMLTESIRSRKMVEVMLNTGKVYLGMAIRCGMGRSRDYDIKIVPFASGYREKDTDELKIARNHSNIVLEFLTKENFTLEELGVAFPISQVVSVRLFDHEVYSKFQKKKPN